MKQKAFRILWLSTSLILPIGFLQLTPIFSQVSKVNAPGTRPINQDKADPHPLFGDDTPENAIRSFYKALAKGDAVTARHLLVSAEKMNEWIEIQIKVSNSFQHLGDAAVAHFGDEGKVLQIPVPAEAALEKLKTTRPTQQGDKAEWRTNPKLPTKMLRKNGHWKLDLYSSFAKPDDLAQLNAAHARVASYVEQIAQDIELGKFQSIAAVRSELKRQREETNKEAVR